MKRKTAILLGVFSFLSLIEIYIALYDFVALDIPRFLIYSNLKSNFEGFAVLFNSGLITAIVHFIVFLVGFIIVVKNINKTHNIHGDLVVIEHEHDVHHIFPQFLSFVAIMASLVSCCFKIMQRENPTLDFVLLVILINLIFVIFPCVLLFIYSRSSNKKWLIITATLIYVVYKIVAVISYFVDELSNYHKFTTPGGVASLFLVVGYSLLIYSILRGVDCHKTFKLLLNMLVIFTLVPYRSIFMPTNLTDFSTTMISLITSACVPVSLDLLVHKALPDKIKEDKENDKI